MNRLNAAIASAGITIIAAAGWLYSAYAIGKHAVIYPETSVFVGFGIFLIVGGLFISHLPQVIWDLCVDQDPLEEPDSTCIVEETK